MAFFHNSKFDSDPIVLHGQGDDLTKPLWAEVRDAFFATPRREIGAAANLTILTWNSREEPGLLERSLDHLGVPYIVKGRGIADWTNSRDKPRLTIEALDEIDTPYIAGIDSFDAIVVDDPSLLIARFEEHFDADLVFNGGKINWPNVTAFRRYEESIPGASESEFRYLNGGAWIGRTDFCRRFFGEACTTEPHPLHAWSEQGVLKQMLPRYVPRVQIDYRCRMFQTLGYVFERIFTLSPSRSRSA
jgi:hypothetical protein